LAGSPCQGFSTSGKRLVTDPRNRLLFRAGAIALRVRPRIFVLENVPTAISGHHQQHWRLVEDMMRWYGYNVRRYIADGAESGVAQIRRRLFLIAWIGSDCIRIEPPPVRPITLSEALVGVEHVRDHDPIPLRPKSREALIVAHIAPGQKLSNVRAGASAVHTWHIPEVFGSVSEEEAEILDAIIRLRRRARLRTFGDADPVRPSTLNRHFGCNIERQVARLIKKRYLRWVGRRIDLTHTYNGKFRRLRWDALSPTVDTHFGDPALFVHPVDDRGFTPREAARIQGFSDDFGFRGSRSRRFQMVGNAVPPPMAARLARFIRAALL
jgi:DNA (cytosine-5)-methyltransferase 1